MREAKQEVRTGVVPRKDAARIVDGVRKCDCDRHRKCIDSRWDPRGYRRRRFVCQECAERWTTIECRVHGRSGDMRKVLAKELGNVRLLPTRELNIMRDFTKALARVLPGGEGSLSTLLSESEVGA